MAITNEILTGDNGDNLVATNISSEIWTKALDGSIVNTLAQQTPISMGKTAVPVEAGRVSAHIPAEGEVKRSSDFQIEAKLITPMKAVVQTRLSEEFIRLNPVNALAYLQGELAKAITRQIDLAVIYGRQAIDGEAITRTDLDPIFGTENKVVIPTDRTLIEDAVLDGEELLAASGYYPTGWAFDPLGVSRFSRATVGTAKAFPELNGINPANVGGFRGGYAAVAPVVSGRVDASADTGTLAIAGNWDAVRIGYNSDIEFEVIEYGDPDQTGRDLKAHNEVLYRSEVFFGFTVLDQDAFVVYQREVEGDEEGTENG